jgi:hypothetical protein
MKLVVVVEVYVEKILMQKSVVVVVVVKGWGGGAIIDAGNAAHMFTISTITITLYRPFQELFHCTINMTLNLRITQFHSFDILQ